MSKGDEFFFVELKTIDGICVSGSKFLPQPFEASRAKSLYFEPDMPSRNSGETGLDIDSVTLTIFWTQPGQNPQKTNLDFNAI